MVKKKKKKVSSENKKPKKERPKMKYYNYTQENLRLALNAVGEGMSMREAGKKFDVPFSTIRCKYQGIYAMGVRSGPPAIFSEAEEHAFVNWILSMIERGFCLSHGMILDSFQIHLKDIKKTTNFMNDRPNKSWLSRFLKRHPALSSITMESLNVKPDAISEMDVRDWHKRTGRYLKAKRLLNIDPSRIFTCEEIGFFLNPSEYKILVDRKQKLNNHVLNQGNLENVVALFTGNITHYIIFFKLHLVCF